MTRSVALTTEPRLFYDANKISLGILLQIIIRRKNDVWEVYGLYQKKHLDKTVSMPQKKFSLTSPQTRSVRDIKRILYNTLLIIMLRDQPIFTTQNYINVYIYNIKS